MSATRIYVVSAEGNKWLVEATSAAQAVRHVTLPYKAAVPSQQELIQLIQGGVKVEKAKAE